MNNHIKTVGYLLKNYTKSQCYDQYVKLSWLEELIEQIRVKNQFSVGDAPDIYSQELLLCLYEDVQVVSGK